MEKKEMMDAIAEAMDMEHEEVPTWNGRRRL